VTEPPQSAPAFRTRPLDDEAPRVRSAFAPILLIVLSVTAWAGFQTVQLVREQQQLEAAKVGLAPQELAATKLRASLDQVAAATAKLAADGNVNARLIVEQLRARGVTINSPAASTPR
jgi:hypothetical protein